MHQNTSERIRSRTFRFAAAGLVAIGAISVAPTPAFAQHGEHHQRTHLWVDAGVQTGTFTCLNVDCSQFALDLHGKGVGTPIGKYTIDSTTFNTWTAANGDTVTSNVGSELVDASDVRCHPDEFPSKTIESFAGGTGRFAHATGSYVARSCLLFYGDPTAPGGAQVQLRYLDVGTITY
jgi:hypothetical protein